MKTPIREAVTEAGVDFSFVVHCIEAHWIAPAEEGFLDEEDIARVRLIRDLMDEFGSNEESIPIILHLLDQLYYLKARISAARKAA